MNSADTMTHAPCLPPPVGVRLLVPAAAIFLLGLALVLVGARFL